MDINVVCILLAVIDFEANLLHFNLLWIICGDFIAFIVTFLTIWDT